MFRAIFEDSKLFRAIFKTIANFLSEGCIKINEDSIHIFGVDEGRITLLDIKIPCDVFYTYEADNNINICVDFRLLRKVLDRSTAADNIELSIGENQELIIELFRGSPDERTNRRIFKLPRMEIEEPSVSIKELEFTTKIELDASYFLEIIKMAKINSDSEVLSVRSIKDEEKIIFSSEGLVGIFTAPIDLYREEIVMRYEIAEDSQSKYNIRYLDKLAPILKTSDFVELSFGKDYPLLITTELAKNLIIKALIAPIVLE